MLEYILLVREQIHLSSKCLSHAALLREVSWFFKYVGSTIIFDGLSTLYRILIEAALRILVPLSGVPLLQELCLHLPLCLDTVSTSLINPFEAYKGKIKSSSDNCINLSQIHANVQLFRNTAEYLKRSKCSTGGLKFKLSMPVLSTLITSKYSVVWTNFFKLGWPPVNFTTFTGWC